MGKKGPWKSGESTSKLMKGPWICDEIFCGNPALWIVFNERTLKMRFKHLMIAELTEKIDDPKVFKPLYNI